MSRTTHSARTWVMVALSVVVCLVSLTFSTPRLVSAWQRPFKEKARAQAEQAAIEAGVRDFVRQQMELPPEVQQQMKLFLEGMDRRERTAEQKD